MSHPLLLSHLPRTANTSSSQPTSGAIKNHSGMKTPTGYEPKELATKELATKELATVSRISRITDPYRIHDAQKQFGERDHRVPITEVVKEFGEIGTHGLPDSKISATSYFQSHMHFDGSPCRF